MAGRVIQAIAPLLSQLMSRAPSTASPEPLADSSALHTSLEEFIEQLDREQRLLWARMDMPQSSGNMAALKARRDTLNVTVYQLRRLLKQAGGR